MIIIRPEGPEHVQGVHRVEEAAFKRPGEANLVDSLRKRKVKTISLVALEDGEVVGHVLYSPVQIVNNEERLPIIGLGPVAVLPSHQNQGIGDRLIRAGLEEARQSGAAAVVVLGNPKYYTRFGFEPAQRYGIRFQDESVPAGAFMILELRRSILEGHQGVAYYEKEFMEV